LYSIITVDRKTQSNFVGTYDLPFSVVAK
jgi:hypothetical protein